jgi:hypothetical protein
MNEVQVIELTNVRWARRFIVEINGKKLLNCYGQPRRFATSSNAALAGVNEVDRFRRFHAPQV